VDEPIVLRISDHDWVDLNGVKLHSVSEVAEALKKVIAGHQDATIAIETDGFKNYETIGIAIYGSSRAGVTRERLRILVDGEPLKT
jgi:biopolymer transport protein ExbD